MIPGLGASWNPDALLNCKTDGYSGGWTLAPFADLVYNPLTNALDDYFTVLPYYYDWRKQVADHAGSVQGLIDANTAQGEDVHLIGHSMGGLVGRAYVESTGANNQLERLLTAGSPHQGIPLTYPAWSGGDIWGDNLFMRIGMTILLRRCSGDNDREIVQSIVPSTQNLLPIFDYLRERTSNLLKPVSSMAAQNNWLPTGFSSPFFGVNVGTLSGQGFQTLEEIIVKERNHRDELLGNWEDGKPIRRQRTSDGDGTVLTRSSQLTGADNRTINRNHGGLVSSQEGIHEILDFLGVDSLPSLPSSTIHDPSSALILIGHPAAFWVTDESGKTIRDRDGVVSILNPRKSKLKLKFLPKSARSLFIVAQFYPNDKTLWKEYQWNYFIPRFKSIDVDPENPKEDAVR